MGEFSAYEYRRQPAFDVNTFEGANQAIPMKTLVIHCFDPRAAEILQAVAEYLGARSTQEKSSPTKMAFELYPREHCLPRPARADAPPSQADGGGARHSCIDRYSHSIVPGGLLVTS
jgi:hypothetical protein